MTEIILQDIIFPKAGVCDNEELYYRKIGFPNPRGIFRGELVMCDHQRIAFDTYFNSFSLLKWAKYTFADSNYNLKLRLKGRFLISLIHMFVEDGGKVNYRVLTQQKIECEEPKDFSFPYVTDNPFGCLAFSIEGMRNGSVFYGACYTSYVDETPRMVKLGIGICTFKREEYVINNMNNLCRYIINNKNCELNDKLEVFISDNGQTLDAKQFNDNHIHVVKNKNTGGSGGFTRCMIEAIKYCESGKDLTNLILMDDDIKFDTDSIIRTYRILSLLKPEYEDSFIGGAMFKMDKPYIQHANGEFWHGERCENFVETYNTNRNMTDIRNIIENEFFTNANYQAWWFCAIPMSTIRYNNLSLPFFIKSDDIEFSIRNLKNLIMLNGINVWHESFESKYSAPNEYYTVRNYLISAALHNSPITKENIIRLLKNYFKHYITNYKYLEIQFLCDAINDFLKGVDYFKSIDMTEFHKKIIKKGYKMVDVKNLPVEVTDNKYFHDIRETNNWTKTQKRLAKFTINGLLLSAKGYSVLGMWGGTYEQTYRKKFLVRYEIGSRKGFILERSRKKAYKMAKLYKHTMKNIKQKFDFAKQDFYNRQSELYNIENWNLQLNIMQKDN